MLLEKKKKSTKKVQKPAFNNISRATHSCIRLRSHKRLMFAFYKAQANALTYTSHWQKNPTADNLRQTILVFLPPRLPPCVPLAAQAVTAVPWHRIKEWLGLEGALEITLFRPLCHGCRCHPLDQAAHIPCVSVVPVCHYFIQGNTVPKAAAERLKRVIPAFPSAGKESFLQPSTQLL